VGDFIHRRRARTGNDHLAALIQQALEIEVLRHAMSAIGVGVAERGGVLEVVDDLEPAPAELICVPRGLAAAARWW
jgi:hypothetical protein